MTDPMQFRRKTDETRDKLSAMEQKLQETVSSVDRGPVKDALRIVVPMMEDQLKLMREILDRVDGR